MKTTMLMLGLLLSTTALAQRPGVRLAAEQARINQGVRTGQLNPQEAMRLEAREQHLRRELRRDRADGVVDPKERARLERQQNRLSRSIYREKHDLR